MQRIRKGLFLMESQGFVNAYLIEGPRSLILVDTGHPRGVAALIAEIEAGGFSLSDVEAIVLTHGHFDHAGGTAGILDRRKIKVFAHKDDEALIKGKALEKTGANPVRWFRRYMRDRRYPYRPIDAFVPVTVGAGLRPLPQWQILHVPGHSAGSLCLFQPTERILICGDVLSNREHRLVLEPADSGYDSYRSVKSLQNLASLDCEVLCCGHGPVIRGAAGLKLQQLSESLL